ncbi:MAG: YecA family protein [Acidimicrobiales bacterium]
MDPAKVEFLFDKVPEGFDLDDPDDRAELLALDGEDPVTDARSAMRAIVAEQILSEDPPAVWATARRLLDLGVHRDQAMAELVMALAHTAQAALAGEGGGFDTDAYEAALASLPLPSPTEVEAAALAIVADGSAVRASDLDLTVLTRLGRAATDPLAMEIVDRVMDRLVDDDGPIALLAGDRVVDVGALTGGIVLTHRLSAAERDLDVLPVDFDLAGFARRPEPRLADGTPLLTSDLDEADRCWRGPPGWLRAYEPGAILAMRADPDGVVTLDLLADEPALDTHLVEMVRTVYDDEVAEPWLPVAGEDLILGVLVVDGDAFAEPRPPLADLCAAAGLEQRGREVAHDEGVWAAQRKVWRIHRVFDALESEEECRAAMRVLDAADSDNPSTVDLRQALTELQDTGVAEVVLAELGADGRAGRFSEALLAAATTPRQTGVARWVAAVVAEEAGDVEGAEAHLHLGLQADPSSGALVERCAWYASDRGRAREALALWHRLGDRRASDIATVEPFARRSGPKLGRNDPCWCGSGRKHKSCHPGEEPPIPLPDRVGWLCRKATAYLEHGGAEARDLVMALALYRATGGDEDSLLDALGDPIVIDAALTEGGWFARFVADRGPLLPEDEALLAQTWLLVPRSVYEVVEVSRGAGLRARDLRTGDVIDVRERTFSREVRPESFVCGRAVPDGETYQFVGGLFPVAPGTEAAVLALCEAEDPEALCDHVGSLYRPPMLRTREGEPIVACTAVLEVPDALAAATILDRHYRRDGEMWVEMFPISEDEEILRATLTMDANRLHVQTHSEPRLDRVLALLGEVLPDARLISDQRTPLRPGEVPAPPHLPGTGAGTVPGPDALAEIQELLEQRWLDESVPALAGLTPRQAAADPTRRDELRRLIASFPTADVLPEGALTMRPARLRELLDL